MGLFHTDRGSVLLPSETALVVSADGELTIRLPRFPEDTQVPKMARLLVAVLLKSEDEDWVDEMIATPR